ncbi:MAG: protein phosphatase [Cyanobacteria bacterium M_surface_7_m2_037]|nr:protein phosphatase [Cyanobacteria bacterium K_DeepCast_0m_m1_088]MBM5795943.1 protein phosphatase [Cyanobacteria bacterium M_surface_7_m2_037]MBM5818984.1 protein phosphatase [Cyanobacteria bacterium K_DeepCast_150m_m2_101]
MTTASPDPLALQATLVDFALAELVRQHRESFPPLWTQESWAKLLIWLALNCGCSGDEAGLKAFAEAIGPLQMGRLRRVFFERELGDLELQLMADPAEQQVLVLPQGPAEEVLQPARIAQALERVELSGLLPADQSCWQRLDAVVAIPWQEQR